jgi:hypothetical protein
MLNRELALLTLPSAVWAAERRAVASRRGTINVTVQPASSINICVIQRPSNTIKQKGTSIQITSLLQQVLRKSRRINITSAQLTALHMHNIRPK